LKAFSEGREDKMSYYMIRQSLLDLAIQLKEKREKSEEK
jgi:hypothetical protein